MTTRSGKGPALLSVEDARRGVLASIPGPVATERVPVAEALGRVLAEPVVARTTLPPWDNSAMDGYAVRAEDVLGASPGAPVRLAVVGDAAAGGAGDAVVTPGIRRMHVLDTTLERTYKEMRSVWNLSKRLPENFPAHFLKQDASLSAMERTRLEDTLGLEPTRLFSTHPSSGDRIRKARQAGAPGIFQLDGPATQLFAQFDVPAKQVTLLHYEDDLGLPLAMAMLVPEENPRPAAMPANQEPTPAPAPLASAPGGLRLKRSPESSEPT